MPTLTEIRVVNVSPTETAIQADFSDDFHIHVEIRPPYGLSQVARAVDELGHRIYVYGQHLKNRPEKE